MFQHTMWFIVHQAYLVLSSATLSNEVFCCSVLIKNLILCVPIITAKYILSCNHRKRKVVEGKHNVLVHYVDARAPIPSSETLSNEIFCWSFLVKNHILCVPDDMPQQQNIGKEKLQEAYTMFQYTMQMLGRPIHLVLSSETLSNDIFCWSFLVKNLILCKCA